MALTIADRVLQTGSANTTVSFTLSGSVSGYQSFSVVGNGNTTYYGAQDGTNWEVGIGTYSTTGPTLTRTTIIASSNSGSAVTAFTTPVTIYVTQPSEYAVYVAGTSIVVPNNAYLGTANGGTGLTSFTANGIVFASTTSILATATGLTWNGTTFNASAVTSGGSAVLTASNYSGYNSWTTGTFTPNTTGVSTGLNVVNGDITTYRSGGTTGVIYLGNSGSRYLYYDGTSYIMAGAALTLNGSNVVTASNFSSYTAGSLTTGSSIKRTAAGAGWLDGQYSGVESTTTSGAIYSIGGASYTPGTTTLGTMYGVGYAYSGNAAGNPGGVPSSVWGMYVASAGVARIWLDSDNGSGYFAGKVSAGSYATAPYFTAPSNGYSYYGPNTTWGAYLKIGGNSIDGSSAQIATSNGNLHLESLGSGYGIYLNYYRAGPIYLGGGTYYFNSGGSYYNGTSQAAINVAGVVQNGYSGYGNTATTTLRNSYYGLLLGSSTSHINVMADNAGNGGFYREANGVWPIYYVASDDCVGINTSTTNSAYGAYIRKSVYTTGYLVLNGAVTVNPSGSMPGQFARAWASFYSRGSITIYNSVNISSVSYSSVGTYTVSFVTAFPSNRYTGAMTPSVGTSSGYPAIASTPTNLTTNYYTVFINDTNANSVDPNTMQVTCFY